MISHKNGKHYYFIKTYKELNNTISKTVRLLSRISIIVYKEKNTTILTRVDYILQFTFT